MKKSKAYIVPEYQIMWDAYIILLILIRGDYVIRGWNNSEFVCFFPNFKSMEFYTYDAKLTYMLCSNEKKITLPDHGLPDHRSYVQTAP